MSADIDGYLTEDVYPSNFPREFSPAWIDATLRHRGLAPPRAPRAAFSLLDLGCGDGAGLVVLAAAYPEGRFLGVDAMPAHVARGAALAARLGVGNVSFRCARFSELEDPAAPEYDYVTAQGVIAWVSPANRAHVYRIAAGSLRPDGVAVFGYNSMPGWKDILVFQHLVRVMAETETETAPPGQRFDAAVDRLRALGAANAPALSEAFWTWFDDARASKPPGYFPHEFLTYWEPQWCDQVAGAMAPHGFALAGLANADRQREDFCFRSSQRRALAEIGDPVARELVADVLFDASFRMDVFARIGRTGTRQPRLDGWWAATVAESEAAYVCDTRAGRLRFDNAAAHVILKGLASGPQALRVIHARGGGGTEADILNAADALFAAGHIAPAEPPADTPFAAALNAEVAEAASRGAGVKALASPYGAFAVKANRIAAGFAGEDAAMAALARLGVEVRR